MPFVEMTLPMPLNLKTLYDSIRVHTVHVITSEIKFLSNATILKLLRSTLYLPSLWYLQSKELVNFNASKRKLLTFTHHRKTSLPLVCMVDAQLHEIDLLRLFGLTFPTDLSWNNYTESIVASIVRDNWFSVP